MTDSPTIFEKKGHPTIKLFDDKISIKAIDYSVFRDFTFDKIKGLEFYRPYDKGIFGLLYSLSPMWDKYRETDNYILRIKLKDGEHWDYETTCKYDQAFVDLIAVIRTRLTI